MTRVRSSKLLATLVALILGAGVATGVAGSATAGQDTSAIAVNTRDGSQVFRLKFQIFKVNGDTVDNGNGAVAYASCSLCQTVAISIQILLVASDPADFEPTNIAIAYNENCTLCDTLASAYQFAVGLGESMKFTAEGRRELAVIRQELNGLRDSGLSGSEIQQQLDGYMKQLAGVLSTELIGQTDPAVQPPSETAGPDASAPQTGTETSPSTTAPEAPAQTTPEQTTTAPAPAPTDTGTTTTETTPTTTETTPTETTSTTPTTTP